MEKRIKSFVIAGKDYTVEYRSGKDSCNLGLCKAPLSKIIIQELWDGEPVPVDSQNQTFFHELAHAALIECGKQELSDDEALVQSLGVMLYEFYKTVELEEK